MPVAKVHIAAGKGPERRKAVAQAVIAAMAMAFKIPEDDVIVLMTERGPDEIYNKDENFILIELLALGSEDPARFYAQMGTLYLQRIGELTSAALLRVL